MTIYRVTFTDNLRRTPGGLKLGVLKPGAEIECSNLTDSGWRRVEESRFGAGWYREAYLEPIEDVEPPEEPDVDPITNFVVTFYHESGAVEQGTFVRI